MIFEYYVYKQNNKNTILSPVELSGTEVRTKPRYIGRNAKIEAINRYCGIDLSGSTSAEVNKWIEENLYSTPGWRSYLTIYNQVRDEKVVVNAGYSLSCVLTVVFANYEVDPYNSDIINDVSNLFLNIPSKRNPLILSVSPKSVVHF